MNQHKNIPDSSIRTKEILANLSEDERKLLSNILQAEAQKLYMQKPRGINEDIWHTLAETIK